MMKRISRDWMNYFLVLCLGVLVVISMPSKAAYASGEFPFDEGLEIETGDGFYIVKSDWNVFGPVLVKDTTIVMDGNLVVQNGGSLTLDNVTLKMNVRHDGQYIIVVKGAMYIQNGSVITDGDADNDTLPPESPENHRFLFCVRKGAEFEMRDSELHECGYGHLLLEHTGLLIWADGVRIHNNLLSHNYFGITLASNYSTISNNTIAHNFEGFLLYHACHNELMHNIEHHNYCDGLFLQSSHWNTIKSNTATFNWVSMAPSCANTLLWDSCHNTLEHCDSSDGYRHGLMISGASCHNTVRYCTVDRNAQNGVYITESSDSNIVENVTVSGNGNGVVLDSVSNNIIKDNRVSDNDHNGVYLTNHSLARIEYCSISNNNGDGIFSEKSSSLIVNYSNIVDNQGYGVQNIDSTVTIDARYNWWGDPSGPGEVGPGEGSAISKGVDYDHWLVQPVAAPRINVFFTPLEQGLNMISLPLKPAVPYTARSFAEMLDATIVIRFDKERQRFIGFTRYYAGEGFPIEGGQGYIVNVMEQKTVKFEGAAWTNEPSVEMAPTTQSYSAWAFVVSGLVLASDEMSTEDSSYAVAVKNLRTGAVGMEAVDDNGYFAVTWADLSRKTVIEAGDKIEVAITDSSGEVVSGPFVRQVTLDNVRDALMHVWLKLGDIIPVKSALLQNYPNSFNPDTWIPYQLAGDVDVTIRIYDAAGRAIRTLDLGYKPAGFYVNRSKAAYWNGRNEAGEYVASGVYFYTIQAGQYTATKKMVVAK